MATESNSPMRLTFSRRAQKSKAGSFPCLLGTLSGIPGQYLDTVVTLSGHCFHTLSTLVGGFSTLSGKGAFRHLGRTCAILEPRRL